MVAVVNVFFHTMLAANIFRWVLGMVSCFVQVVVSGRTAVYFEVELLSYFYQSGLQAGMWRGFIEQPQPLVRHD
jgi:hypothetical protein